MKTKFKKNLRSIKLYIIENNKTFSFLFVILLVFALFLITFYNLNTQYLYEINHGHYGDISEITNTLFYSYFNIILYSTIFVICSIVFLGKQLRGSTDYHLMLILWYLAMFLFSKVNDINVNITSFQNFIAIISDSLYELSTVPLFLYIVLKLNKHSKYMQAILLFECFSSLLYVIGYTANIDSVFSIFKNISCSSIFIITIVAIHIFSIIETKNNNTQISKFLLTELSVVILYFIICISAVVFRSDFYVVLKNSFYEIASNFNIIPLRKAVLQDIVLLSVFLDYCTIAFKQYIEYVERNKSVETELKLSESYNEIAQIRIKEVRKLKHDIKEHINMAYMYCESGDYKKLKEYLETLGAETAALPALSYSNNVPCNHILVYYSEKAKINGIEFSAMASVGENIGISDSEATSLLSNILKNAYEACLEYKNAGNEKPYIHFSMHLKNSKIYLTCENSSLPDVHKNKNEKGRFKTTKTNTAEHGLGMAIVENICETHNGAVIFDLIGNKFTVNATIPIELK